MDCNSFLVLALLLFLLFPFPHFFLITLTYVWPKVTAGVHKWHIPYKSFSGQGCYKVVLSSLLFPLPHWMSPSLGLHSIGPFAWLNAKLHLQNDLTLAKNPLKRQYPGHSPIGMEHRSTPRSRVTAASPPRQETLLFRCESSSVPASCETIPASALLGPAARGTARRRLSASSYTAGLFPVGKPV